MAENKVRFGLKNVYYAVLTEGATNAWATPVHVAGAVSLTLDDASSSNPFYADNITYYRTFANNGYTGSLEMALIPEAMLADIWGIEEDATDKIIYEKTGVQPKPFALIFQVDTDDVDELNLFYRVVPTTKPISSPATTEDTVEPFTTSFDFEALPLVSGSAVQQGLIKAKTTPTTTEVKKTAWFSEVYVPTA